MDRARARSGVTAARERRTAVVVRCAAPRKMAHAATTRHMADAEMPSSPRETVRSVPYRAHDARAHTDSEGESTRQEHTTRVWYRLYRSSRSQVVRKLRLDQFRSSPQGSALAELGSVCSTVPHYIEYGEHHRVGERWDGRPFSKPDTRHAGHFARNSLRNGGVANEWNRVQHARRRSA